MDRYKQKKKTDLCGEEQVIDFSVPSRVPCYVDWINLIFSHECSRFLKRINCEPNQESNRDCPSVYCMMSRRSSVVLELMPDGGI